MAENIFEELVEEIRKILGDSFRIRVKTEDCDFCFKDLKQEKIREALQKTVSFAIASPELKLKKFIFENKETEDLRSLTLVLIRLTHIKLNSLHKKKDQIAFVKHLSECGQYWETLLDTFEYFTCRLMKARKKWRKPFLRFFKNLFRKIFGLKEKSRLLAEINANLLHLFHPYLLSLIMRTKIFVNSEEKRKVFQKYIPLLAGKNIEPERILAFLAKCTHEKQEDLTAEEFEKTLKNLLGVEL